MEFITFTTDILENEVLATVREIGRQIGVKKPAGISKSQLIQQIIAVQKGEIEPVPESKRGAPPKMRLDVSHFYKKQKDTSYEFVKPVEDTLTFNDSMLTLEGVLDLKREGYGFIRANNYDNSKTDFHIDSNLIRKYNLRSGDLVKATAQRKNTKEAPGVYEVLEINHRDPAYFIERKNFDDLRPAYPTKKLNLENNLTDHTARIIDLLAPIGMGQRGLIVAPPKTGKTTLLKEIAKSIEDNHPAVKLIILLIDERPEEVTDIINSTTCEVVYSTFDEVPEHHIKIAELVLNRAKRLVELGENVVILMDSITRLARAYNYVVEPSGRTLSGGLDPLALQGPKRFFGAARNIELGGSLTILSTALVDTESKLDDVIFEEFKGTGNMEIRLSRELAERRVFPAIDINKSGTRKDELILSKEEYQAENKLRKLLAQRKDATEVLIDMLNKTKTNKEFIAKLDTWIDIYQK